MLPNDTDAVMAEGTGGFELVFVLALTDSKLALKTFLNLPSQRFFVFVSHRIPP